MRNQFFQNLLANLGATSFEVAFLVLNLLPPPLRLPVVSVLGFLFGRLATGMRKALTTNLVRVLNTPDHEVERMADRIFKNFALTLLDFFFPDPVTIEVPERAKLEKVRSKNKGVIMLTFHMGHWELGARTMRGWGWPVTAIYQPYQNKKFKQVIESRRAPGVNFIPVGGAATTGVREALKRGDMVAMLGDHPFGEEGMPVELLGQRVIWPKGPVVLAARERTPIVVAVIIRTSPHHYTALIEDPLVPQSKTKAEVERLVQAVADKFGSLISRHAEQWYRFRLFEFVESSPKENNRNGLPGRSRR